MRSVHLHGRLGKAIGPSFNFEVRSAIEAVRALIANFPHTTEALRQGHYRIICGDRKSGLSINRATLDLYLPAGQDIHIIPAGGGAKSGGLGKTIAGVALLAVAIIAPMAGAGALSLFGGAISWTSIGMMGAALTFTGISQMLTSTPKMPDAADMEREATPSFVLGGTVNASQAGNPVPIIGGMMRTGGVVISGGVSVEDFK